MECLIAYRLSTS